MRSENTSTLAAAFFTATFALAACVFAQTTPPATTTSTRPAQTRVLAANTVLQADVPYGGPDATLNVLDVYAPKDAKNAPILFFVHGGEWSRGDKHDISTKPKFFNEHGVIFVATNYRLSPKAKHPSQVDDIALAIKWTKGHAKEFGGDPNKIVIMGHSAGCHIVTLTTLWAEPLKKAGLTPSDIKGVIAWSGGMYDLVARANGPGMYPPFIKATFGEDAESQKAGSPMTYTANAKTCPPFLFASVDDEKSQSSREASTEMVKRINAAGGKAETVILIGKSHFTANHEVGAPGDTTGAIILNFLSSVTQ